MYALYTYKFLMRSQSTCISQVVKNGQDVIIQTGKWSVCVCVFKIDLQQLFVARCASGTGHLPLSTRLVLCQHRLEAIW